MVQLLCYDHLNLIMMAVIGKEQIVSEKVLGRTLGICQREKTLPMSKALL